MDKQRFCRFFLEKILGWKIEGQVVPEPKCVILGVPHTSLWDFPISFLFYTALGGYPRIAIKKSFFFWPMGPILRKCGAIPVDRAKGTSFVNATIEVLRKEENFHLAIAPEGTRKPTSHWRGGFHLIARRLNLPVYYGYFDWGTKCVGIGPRVEITPDMQADIQKIKAWYKAKGVKGKHPQNFIY